MVDAVAMDIQPVTNLRILVHVGNEKKADWAKHFQVEGFKALEAMLEKSAGKYCYGDSITLADLALVPQAYNGDR